MPDLLVEFDDFEKLAASFLNAGQRMRFKARGNSMRPFILDGDLVEVQPIETHKPNRGDVVLCRLHDGRLVVHRVIQVAQDYVLIQGDALPYPDGRIPYTQVLGKVDTVFRRNKQIQMNTPWKKFLVGFWLVLTPLRSILLRGIHRLRRGLPPRKIIETSDENLYH